MADLAATIESLRLEQHTALSNAEEAERQIICALWYARGEVTIDRMCEWTGWSKQTLYNKWNKYGYKIQPASFY